MWKKKKRINIKIILFNIIMIPFLIIFIIFCYTKKQSGGKINKKSILENKNMYEYIGLHQANVENNIRYNILNNFYYLHIPETYHEDIMNKYNKFYNTDYDYEDNKHNKTIFIVHLYRKFYLPLLNYKNKIYLQKFKEDCNKLNNINSTYFEYFNLYKYFYNDPKLWNKIWNKNKDKFVNLDELYLFLISSINPLDSILYKLLELYKTTEFRLSYEKYLPEYKYNGINTLFKVEILINIWNILNKTEKKQFFIYINKFKEYIIKKNEDNIIYEKIITEFNNFIKNNKNHFSFICNNISTQHINCLYDNKLKNDNIQNLIKNIINYKITNTIKIKQDEPNILYLPKNEYNNIFNDNINILAYSLYTNDIINIKNTCIENNIWKDKFDNTCNDYSTNEFCLDKKIINENKINNYDNFNIEELNKANENCCVCGHNNYDYCDDLYCFIGLKSSPHFKNYDLEKKKIGNKILLETNNNKKKFFKTTLNNLIKKENKYILKLFDNIIKNDENSKEKLRTFKISVNDKIEEYKNLEIQKKLEMKKKEEEKKKLEMQKK